MRLNILSDMRDPKSINKNPYTQVYPELSVLELPLTLLLMVALIVSIPFLIWNGLYHLFHLLGVSLGSGELIFLNDFLSMKILTDPVLGPLVDVGAVIITIFYVYLLVFVFKMFYPMTRQTISRIRTISLSEWDIVRVRRLMAHSFYAQIGYWLALFAIWYVWISFIIPAFDSLWVSTAIFLFGFFIAMFFFTLLSSTEKGHKILDTYFRVFGGYEDGSVGRRLHVSYRSLEDQFTREELEHLLSEEQFDRLINIEELEEARSE